jgi:two-component SAPR family response regulator
MPINAMITEDDLFSRTMLCDLLEDYFPDVHIVGMAQTVKESVEYLINHKIDLLFLDIELPDGKGPDILKSLQNVDFTVIITTSFVKYAEELCPRDIHYTILKPLTRESLDKAMKCFSEKNKSHHIK